MLIKLHTLCQKDSYDEGNHTVEFYWREGLYPVFRVAIHEIHELDDVTPGYPSGAMMVGDVLGGLARVQENYHAIVEAIACAELETTVIEVPLYEEVDPDYVDNGVTEDEDSIELAAGVSPFFPPVIEPQGIDPELPSPVVGDTSAEEPQPPSTSERSTSTGETGGFDPR